MDPLILSAMFDELEKIGASYRSAGYMQARSGVRPIRAHNLANKGFVEQESVTQAPDAEQPQAPELETGDSDDLGKEAKVNAEDAKSKALEGYAKARPYIISGVKGAVPAALLGGVLGGKKGSKVFGAVGAAAGVTDRALRSWAEENRRNRAAKALLRQQDGAFSLRKTGAKKDDSFIRRNKTALGILGAGTALGVGSYALHRRFPSVADRQYKQLMDMSKRLGKVERGTAEFKQWLKAQA
jgi:hypothetical protein